MGYMGLSTFVESDNASDFIHEMHDIIARAMTKELSNKANNVNTDGIINVALFIESHLNNLTSAVSFFKGDSMYKVLHKTRELLENKIKETKDVDVRMWNAKDKKYHLVAYRRMLKNINKIINKHCLT